MREEYYCCTSLSGVLLLHRILRKGKGKAAFSYEKSKNGKRCHPSYVNTLLFQVTRRAHSKVRAATAAVPLLSQPSVRRCPSAAWALSNGMHLFFSSNMRDVPYIRLLM